MPPSPEGRTRLLLWTAVLVLALPGLLRGVELSQRQPAAAPDASLITRIVANQQAAMKRLLQFCFRQRILEEKLRDDGRVKETEEREELVCHLDGVPLYKQLLINGQPTGQRKTDPWPDIRKDNNWQKQVQRAAKRHQRYQTMIGEVPKAIDFERVGERMVEGRRTVLYRLTPKPSYRSKSRATELLRHITALSWVDPESAHVVRFQAQVKRDFNVWGGVLLKVRQGATMEVRQRPVNGVWLPYFAEERWHARIGLIKNQGYHKRVERTDFRPASELPNGRQSSSLRAKPAPDREL